MNYQVKVDNFEGPMDLLLFFIQRDKLNIYDIPIAHITKEFLDYMKMIEFMNIDLGGRVCIYGFPADENQGKNVTADFR